MPKCMLRYGVDILYKFFKHLLIHLGGWGGLEMIEADGVGEWLNGTPPALGALLSTWFDRCYLSAVCPNFLWPVHDAGICAARR
jgi:hypothetical protein